MYLDIAAKAAHFCDSWRNTGEFLGVVEMEKRFVNVHLQCIISSLNKLNIDVATLGEISADAHGPFNIN